MTFRARESPVEGERPPAGALTDPATARLVAELADGPLSRRELAERTGLASHVVRYRLGKLRDAGAVRPTGAPRDPRVRWELRDGPGEGRPGT